jgi:hypothetical protein
MFIWVATTRKPVGTHPHFGGVYCLHLQGFNTSNLAKDLKLLKVYIFTPVYMVDERFILQKVLDCYVRRNFEIYSGKLEFLG